MKVWEKADSFYDIFERKSGPAKEATHYCPGCGHGNIHKWIAEALSDMDLAERTIFVSPVGCSVFGFYYFNTGNSQAPHGRAPAVATGFKRANPDSIVISYQGDGDLAAIGTSETLHAANRGENITVIFVNNAIYGMTGGQMAPTTLIKQRTATTPRGREEVVHGNPIRMCELISTLPAVTYVERVAVGKPKHLMKARKAIRKALKNQAEGRGYSFIEILATCPTGWKMSPPQSRDWMLEEMTKVFPLGVFKDESADREGEWHRHYEDFDPQKVGAYLHNWAGGAELPSQQMEIPNLNCKFAGFGGQGILTLGLFLAQIGMRAGAQVSWIPSYGPEMRGGTANCQVQVSKERIGTPLVEKPNILVAMNKPSLDSFEADVVPGGLVLVDGSIVEAQVNREDLRSVHIPASEIADKAGTPKVANVVILGALVAAIDAFPKEFIESTLRQIITKKHLVEINIRAFQEGYAFVKGE